MQKLGIWIFQVFTISKKNRCRGNRNEDIQYFLKGYWNVPSAFSDKNLSSIFEGSILFHISCDFLIWFHLKSELTKIPGGCQKMRLFYSFFRKHIMFDHVWTWNLLELRHLSRFHARPLSICLALVQSFTDKEWRNPLH